MNNRHPVNPDNTKITALYERLSNEDDVRSESCSIQNQKSMLEKYAKDNGFSNPQHFSDDGYTGGNFDRPDWKRLIAEVEAGNIGAVIMKDMSRFGRDHVQVGMYMELFRQRGVRFIAISNGIDSINPDTLEFAPFLNIMAEWYLRDASRKITAVMRAKGKEGKRLTSHPIYGYMNDPDDKEKWIIDEEAATIVRRIFQMTIEGIGPHVIARKLSEENIERPSYYLAMRGRGSNKTKYDPDLPYSWNSSTITSILAKQEYIGHTVNFRYYKDSYKDKNCKRAPKEDWLIFENTHPGIVDIETFETAQHCRKTKKRTNSLGEANPLTGKMFCADCGARMYNHRKPYTTPHYNYNGTGKTYTRGPSDVYSCSTHDNAKVKFVKNCTLHSIRTAVVRELVLDTIRAASGYVKKNEAEFVRQVREASVIQQDKEAKDKRKLLTKNQKRIAELNTLIRKIYEDNVSGKLTDKRFEVLSAEYEKEQDELEKFVAVMQTELDSFTADGERADKFIDLVRRYTDFTELTPTMINEFVEKVIVHEADKSTGERMQRVDIYLNFIGKFDVPMPEPTPEEIAEEEKKRKARAKRREYEHRYWAKRRAKLLAENQNIEQVEAVI